MFSPCHSSIFKITIFHFLIIQSRSLITFNFSNIYDHQRELTLYNSSYVSTEGLQITPNEIGVNQNLAVGRAIYNSPLHLWDNSTGELADFSTNFTFIISGSIPYADGFTFFLAENNSVITVGGAIGLPANYTTGNATSPFVAVEFDTYFNQEWDPVNSTNSSIGDHVGININYLGSVQSMKWFSNITGGAENQAWVNYDAASHNLSVRFTGFRNNQMEIQSGLSYTVDLRRVLPERVIFGFSAATGKYFQRNNVRSWSFNSSTLKVDEEQNSEGSQMSNNNTILPPQVGPEVPSIKKREITGLVRGLIISLSVLVVALLLLGFGLWKKKKREKLGVNKFMENEFEMVSGQQELEVIVSLDKELETCSGPKKFLYTELMSATNNFAEKDKLGEGGFGGVYKGLFRDSNTYVAVKRVSSTSRQGIKEYMSEVKIISRLGHKNLVRLIGWCHEKGELLLVYEFMGNGSLDSHLFNGKSLLIWETRFKIAQGIASALLYLHEEWEQCVVHRDIKSSNIMLSMSFKAKLGDFGLARLVDHEKWGQTTVVAGTMGYMAPEYMETGKASKESDIFSFGVVALEIACGRKPIDFKAQESQIRMVEWVWNLYGTGNLLDAADPKMGLDYDNQEIKRLMIVGLWCAHPDWKLRPSIRHAIHVLNGEAPLPNLPSKMPVATYFAPPSSFSSLANGESSQVNSLSYSYNTDSSKLTSSSAASSPSASLLYTNKVDL